VSVSAILPVRNAEKTVPVVLECLFASEYVPSEVIVVDDASTDRTLEVCRKFPVVLIPLERNVGPAEARNIAVRKSSGDILLFLDSDIRFPPSLLGGMVRHMEEDPGIAGVFTVSSAYPLNPGFLSRLFALQEYVNTTWGLRSDGTRRLSYICTRCGLLRRSVFDEVGGFNPKYTEPSCEDLAFSAFMANRHVLLMDSSLVHEHHWPDSLAKLFRRYYLNSRGIMQLPLAQRRKATALFSNDFLGRVMTAASIGSAPLGLVWPWAWSITAGLMLAAIVSRRRTLGVFLRAEGLWFTIKAWGIYILTLIPFAAGTLQALWQNLRHRSAKKAPSP